MSMSRIDDYEVWYDDQDPSETPLDMDLILSDSGIEQSIFRDAAEILGDLGSPKSFAELVGDALNSHYSVIESNVGDDANVTTNSEMYGLLTLCAATKVSFIKLSMKDIGISKRIANYAEGWMLTPPSAGSSFEAVNRYNKGRGLAFVMDPVKLKLLSAVRKQSSEELDLESKLTHLAEIAAWTDRSWFTYDFHQMSLILANCVFDFNDAHTFPFLYKTEGGCGGMPPYGNVATAYSALHYYTRGRSKRAITGVMQESLRVLFAEMSPKDTYFLRASHLANAGDGQWARYESAYRTMIEHGQLSRLEARDMLKEMQGSQLDPSIIQMGYEVTPEVYTVGSAIGHLRSKGYLMTEVDVKLLSQKVEKERAVFGDKRIGDILREQEEDARIFKSQAWKLLTQLYSGSRTIRKEVDGRLGLIDDSYEAFAAIAEEYYRMRGDHNAEFSSFFYTDAIRVFKTKDIQEYFGKARNLLMEDFGLTSFFPKTRPLPEENRFEQEARHEIESWLDSGHLADILEGPLPTGIGNDDARILRELDTLVPTKANGFVAVILSDDSGLIRAASAILKRKAWGTQTTACVCQLRRNDYTAICLQGVRERFDLQLRNREEPPRFHKVPYYNYIMKRMWLLPDVTTQAIRDFIPGTYRKRVECNLYYDVPNLERGLERTHYNPETNTVTMFGGGCLDRRTVDSLPYGQSWAELPLSSIFEWEDFSEKRRKILYARDIKIKRAAYVARPERMVSTRNIQFWLNSAVQPHPVPVI